MVRLLQAAATSPHSVLFWHLRTLSLHPDRRFATRGDSEKRRDDPLGYKSATDRNRFAKSIRLWMRACQHDDSIAKMVTSRGNIAVLIGGNLLEPAYVFRL
ncbi:MULTISPECIES: hypothetical protein [unclassified Agrobacterium]|uniref:hypothetical protein n=1 Tax=unclassified Agrobacterium TaxID=2632611 RepID=UPI001590BF54|nr:MULTISPECIES: hypothetical protein [unclassified Agrobacterium]